MKPTSFAALAVVTVLALAVAIATYGAQNRWSQAKVSGRGAVSQPRRPGGPDRQDRAQAGRQDP